MNIKLCKLDLNTPVKYASSTSQVLQNWSRHICWPQCWERALEAPFTHRVVGRSQVTRGWGGQDAWGTLRFRAVAVYEFVSMYFSVL